MKRALIPVAIIFLLSVIVYYADWLLDDEHVDCFDNKVNHVFIFAGSMMLIAIAVLCFVLFYHPKKKNDYERK